MREFHNFTEAYYKLLATVYHNPEYVCSPRGAKIKESLCVQFKIKNPRDRIPYIKKRDFSISYMIAELVWYMTGNDSTKWISNYSAFWNKISDDGYTANSAYGARIFLPHKYSSNGLGWTQWNYVLNELTEDIDSRRAVIHIRSPYDSINAKKDVPCTLALQFFVRNEKLCLAVNMRSSDLILGLSYDVPAFTMFQELMAHDLSVALGRKIELGDYIHTSNSLHIYEKHFETTENILDDAENISILSLINRDPDVFSSIYAMPELPSRDVVWVDGVNLINQFENHVVNTHDSEKLVALTENVQNLDPYWQDWAYILASHRAMRLDDDVTKSMLMQRCNFDGYKRFEK